MGGALQDLGNISLYSGGTGDAGRVFSGQQYKNLEQYGGKFMPGGDNRFLVNKQNAKALYDMERDKVMSKYSRPQAPRPQAPRPQAPRPQAPRPQAPRPQAPRPQAPRPQAPRPQAPRPQARPGLQIPQTKKSIWGPQAPQQARPQAPQQARPQAPQQARPQAPQARPGPQIPQTKKSIWKPRGGRPTPGSVQSGKGLVASVRNKLVGAPGTTGGGFAGSIGRGIKGLKRLGGSLAKRILSRGKMG